MDAEYLAIKYFIDVLDKKPEGDKFDKLVEIISEAQDDT